MRALFVIGHPKSGTSLVNSLLDSHPDLLILSEESDFYLSVWPRARMLNLQWRRDEEDKIKDICNHILSITHFKNYYKGIVDKDISGNLDYEDFPKEEFKSELRLRIGKSMVDKKFFRRKLFDAILTAYISALGLEETRFKFWVEKTPKHTWHIGDIYEDFESPFFLFVHRDPRDNYVSYNKKLKGNLGVIEFCKTWNSAYEIMESQDKQNIYVVKYEDLIENRDTVLRVVLEEVEVAWNDKVLSPTKLGKVWKGNSMFNITSDGIHNKSVGRYKSILSEYELKIIDFLCGGNMKAAGYELSLPSSELLPEEAIRVQKEYNKIVPFHKYDREPLRHWFGRLRRKVKGK